MKMLPCFIFLVLTLWLVSSCQKELYFPVQDSEGTLKSDSAADCLPSVVHGTFIQGTALNDSNYIDVDLNITSAGLYTIYSDTINGFSFNATGTFESTGITTVRLYAAGTATTSGTNIFTIKYDSSFCRIDVSVIAAPVVTGYSFPDCNGLVVYGDYMQGIPTDLSDSIVVEIAVSTPGNYFIATDSVNGVQFYVNAGFTSTASPQSLTIIGHGTPLSAGTFDYTIVGGCTFSVTFTAAPIDYIMCDIDGVTTSFNVADTAHLNNLSTPTELYISGLVSATSNEKIFLTILGISATDLTTNTYDVNLPATEFYVQGTYTDNTSIDWIAKTTGVTQTPAFSISIASFSIAPGGRITGTFSGPVKNNGGNGPGVKTISNGMFDLLLR